MIIPTSPCITTIWDDYDEDNVQVQLLEAPAYSIDTYAARAIRTDESPDADGWQRYCTVIWEPDEYGDQQFVRWSAGDEYNVHSGEFRRREDVYIMTTFGYDVHSGAYREGNE